MTARTVAEARAELEDAIAFYAAHRSETGRDDVSRQTDALVDAVRREERERWSAFVETIAPDHIRGTDGSCQCDDCDCGGCTDQRKAYLTRTAKLMRTAP